MSTFVELLSSVGTADLVKAEVKEVAACINESIVQPNDVIRTSSNMRIVQILAFFI